MEHNDDRVQREIEELLRQKIGLNPQSVGARSIVRAVKRGMRVGKMQALSDYMGEKNLQNIRFDTLQNSLDIKKGKITIPAMRIESTLGHIELSGTHDNNQNIDYYVRIPWKTVRKAAWQKLFGKKKDSISSEPQEDEIVEVDPNKKVKYLNLKIKGNIDDYKISLGKKRKK